MSEKGKLEKDMLRLASDKSLYDIRTVLKWAEESETLEEKTRHITHALELLAEVKENLEALR